MDDCFIKLVQKRIAFTSIGASTARGMAKNTAKNAHGFLKELDLKRLRQLDRTSFEAELDRITCELEAALPENARWWGSARKFLNIFLRGALYDRYLCEHYGLSYLEPWLEVPLDSHVTGKTGKSGLRGEHGSESLPDRKKWSVRGLNLPKRWLL